MKVVALESQPQKIWICRSSRSQMLVFLKTFVNLTGKHLCWSLFLCVEIIAFFMNFLINLRILKTLIKVGRCDTLLPVVTDRYGEDLDRQDKKLASKAYVYHQDLLTVES